MTCVSVCSRRYCTSTCVYLCAAGDIVPVRRVFLCAAGDIVHAHVCICVQQKILYQYAVCFCVQQEILYQYMCVSVCSRRYCTSTCVFLCAAGDIVPVHVCFCV